MKKALSVILALSLVLSLFTISAGAESIEQTAKKTLEIGKSYNLKVPAWDGSSSLDLKIVMPKTGNLTLKYTHYAEGMAWNLFDSNGKTVVATKFTAGTGTGTWHNYNGSLSYHMYNGVLSDGSVLTKWNNVSEKAQGEATYKIEKGTYYLRIARTAKGISDLKLSVSAKDMNDKTITSGSADSKKATAAILTVSLKKGGTIQLGADLTPADSKSTVTWKTSKKAVATVSSKGAVKAVAKGSADITATVDGISIKVRVKVTE